MANDDDDPELEHAIEALAQSWAEKAVARWRKSEPPSAALETAHAAATIIAGAIRVGATLELVGRKPSEPATTPRYRAWIESASGARYAESSGDALEPTLIELARRWAESPREQLSLPAADVPRCTSCWARLEGSIIGDLLNITHAVPWCIEFARTTEDAKTALACIPAGAAEYFMRTLRSGNGR